MGEDVRDGKLLLQALRGFGLVGCECCDVDQGGHPVVCSGVRDQGTAVRVADEDDGAADPPEAAGDALLFRESSPCWEQITSCLSACSVGISFWKHEPSAHNPWANTIPGLVCLDMIRSFDWVAAPFPLV